KMTDAQAREAINAYQKSIQAKAAEKNKKEGEQFLATNKAKPGIISKEIALPDGKTAELQYWVMKEGTGETPKLTDTVRVNYRGRLINGTEFDSSAKHGPDPAKFPVNGVVKGWTEALQLMKVGSKYQLFIPSNLAYGERAVSPDLGANSTLIFEVELMDAKPAPTPAAPGAAAPKGAPRPATSPSPKK